MTHKQHLLLCFQTVVCVCECVCVCVESIRLQQGLRQRKERRVRKRFSFNFSPWDWSPWLRKHFQPNVGQTWGRGRAIQTEAEREITWRHRCCHEVFKRADSDLRDWAADKRVPMIKKRLNKTTIQVKSSGRDDKTHLCCKAQLQGNHTTPDLHT